MPDLGLPSSELDPYFSPAPTDRKPGAKGSAAEIEDLRQEIAAARLRFRRTGTLGMLLGTFVFVLFAIPTARILTQYGDADGLLADPAWLRTRWEARMASVLGVSVLAVGTCWGLRRLRPWSRHVLIALSTVPAFCLAAAVFGPGRAHREELLVLFVVGLFASAWILRSVSTGPGRIAFSPEFQPGPKLEARPADWAGARRLAAALLVAFWVLLMALLNGLAAAGRIRTP